MLQVQIQQTMVQETPDADAPEPPGTSRSLLYPDTDLAAPMHALPLFARCSFSAWLSCQRLHPWNAVPADPHLAGDWDVPAASFTSPPLSRFRLCRPGCTDSGAPESLLILQVSHSTTQSLVAPAATDTTPLRPSCGGTMSLHRAGLSTWTPCTAAMLKVYPPHPLQRLPQPPLAQLPNEHMQMTYAL